MVARVFSTRKISVNALFFCAGLFLLFFCACQAPATRRMTEQNMAPPVLFLSPGDALEITFPGATNLTGIRRIGPEGSITMPIIGQVQAAGKTTAELEAELEQKYGTELQDKDVVVTFAASANVVYVSGAVMRPGRISMDRPLTALEVILEAGGFAPDANMKKVTVFRYEGTENVTYILNLKPVFEGGPVPPFYLMPRDVILVKKKVQWF
jgi:polysaccharide biosynthesis/export protein